MVSPKGGAAFDVVVPKGYKPTEKYTTIAVVPPRVDDAWMENKQHFAAPS